MRTESVFGSRLSAAVRIILDEATRNVAAIPFKAWNINLRVMNSLISSFFFFMLSLPVRQVLLYPRGCNLNGKQFKYMSQGNTHRNFYSVQSLKKQSDMSSPVDKTKTAASKRKGSV
jgi:hypothetical protein